MPPRPYLLSTPRRRLAIAAIGACAMAASASTASASEIELVRPVAMAAPVVAPQVVEVREFDSFPAHLLPAHAAPAKRAPDAMPEARREGEPPLLVEAWTLTSMLEWPGLSPLEMQQPMRVYESDVVVKFRAPGGRSSFATVELIF